MSGVLILALAYPAAIALLFWLAFLRPVQQHQKKQRDELANLRVGDEVLTQAGFIARIVEIRVPEEAGPTEIILDLGGARVRATASAVVQRLNPAGEPGLAPGAETMNINKTQGSPNA
jgi:preprotein translocase subunit YajC